MEAKNLADLYDLPLVDWASIEARLEQGMTQAPGGRGTRPSRMLAGDDQP
jgi:hypothetical protein